jgi:hypothetical protein
MSVAEKCLAFSGLFEAELLIELMLRHWSHPLAADWEFRNTLLECAAEVLRTCIAGQQVMEDLSPDQMNFVAAAWYVECNALSANAEDDPEGLRRAWLDKVRQAIPSCFCPPESLS